MKKQYTWEISKDAEVWNNDIFNTVNECVDDYLKNTENPRESIFVGEAIPFSVSIDGKEVIEDLEESAYEECGEVAEDWEPSIGKSLSDWEDLDKQLTEVVCDWLKKHNDMPTFYSIKDIREVFVDENRAY